MRCGRDTVGLLSRRPVTARTISHTGKEANRLEEAQAGLFRDVDEILTVYEDPRHLALRQALPVLQALGVREVARRTGHSVGAVHSVLRGQSTPRPRALTRYLALAASPASPMYR